MNVCVFTGRVASDPALRGPDQNVLVFRLAVNGRQFNGANWEDRCDFIDCSMFGRRAESVSGFLKKGQPVTVQAHARQNTWEDQDGAKKSRIEFRIDDLQVGRAND